jgi:cell division protein FtsB
MNLKKQLEEELAHLHDEETVLKEQISEIERRDDEARTEYAHCEQQIVFLH